MTSITRLLPRTSPLFLGPLFLLASFFLLTFKTVSPLQTLMLLGGGLAITVLGGLRALVLVIPFTAYAFYTLLPVSLWSIGVFALTTVAYLQSALAIDEQSEEIDSKEEILKAALKLFVEFGFHATPTSKIAKEAGVANGTLFHYYKTKEELILALYSDTKKRLTEYMYSNISKADSLDRKSVV